MPFDAEGPQRPICALGTLFSYNRKLSETEKFASKINNKQNNKRNNRQHNI